MGLDADRGRIDQMKHIKLESRYFFEKRFIEKEYRKPKIGGVQFSILFSVESSSLEAPFFIEEIKEVV